MEPVDLSTTIAAVQCLCLELGYAERDGNWIRIKEMRLLQWAIACLAKTGKSQEQILDELNTVPAHRHWNHLFSQLPNEAITALENKLTQQLGNGSEAA
ncbi:MAG: hypothetical protein AAFX78_10185 [Cyanobacteria bacterium J06638_20]